MFTRQHNTPPAPAGWFLVSTWDAAADYIKAFNPNREY